jgi:two-component system response regulator FixJ
MRSHGQSRTTKVLVLDPDLTVLDSASAILGAVGFTVERFSGGDDLLARASSGDIGCVVSELLLPDMSWLSFLDAVHAQLAGAPVVFVTQVRDVETAVQALRHGAFHYLIKPVCETALVDAVREAAELHREDRCRARACESYLARRSKLTPRGRDVLALVMADKSNKEIAHDLGISIRTVEAHRARMMRRLGTQSLIELVRLEVESRMRSRTWPMRLSGPGRP